MGGTRKKGNEGGPALETTGIGDWIPANSLYPVLTSILSFVG